MKTADVSLLEGKTIVALLMGTVRAERYCDGVILDLLREGTIRKWPEQLSDIDKSNQEA